ncbi:MAG: aminotransferase class IV [Rickettsiales bacterium]
MRATLFFYGEYDEKKIRVAEWRPIASPVFPADDRGVRLGDGAFETVRIEGGAPVYACEHVARLRIAERLLRLPPFPFDVEKLCREACARNGAPNALARLVVTRGGGGSGYAMPSRIVARCVLTLRPLPARKIKPWTLRVASYRKIPPECIPTACKTLQGLSSILALNEAKRRGADESLFLTPDGCVAGCASANIFWIKRRTLFTPSLDTGALAGVVRARVIQTSPFPVREGRFPLRALLTADTAFASSSGIKIKAVRAVAPYVIFREDIGIWAENKFLRHMESG